MNSPAISTPTPDTNRPNTPSPSTTRQAFEPALFRRQPINFLAKFFLAMGLIAGASSIIAMQQGLLATLLAMLVNGLLFAHLIELQHECSHGHAFASPTANRLFGICCGLFLFSSHSHYRYDHLRHHAYLGTAQNGEHFDYRFSRLDSYRGFILAFFDLSRYLRLARVRPYIFSSTPLPGITQRTAQRAIKLEYAGHLLIFLAAVIIALYSGGWIASTLILAWWLPALLISEGVHFLIELPEHFGLNTMSQPDVLANTRSIRASRLARWFVNGNNLHTAHHYHPGVPMCQVPALHRQIEAQLIVHEPSYWSFYRAVLTGRIQHEARHSCMQR